MQPFGFLARTIALLTPRLSNDSTVAEVSPVLTVQVAWLEARAATNPVAKPSTIATTGSGHHQCSKNAPKP
jgi:hypothetical protein